jgi:hypothetical protein
VLLDLYMDDPVRALPYFEQLKAASGEDKQVNAWLADVRQRAGRQAPAAPDGGSVGRGGEAAEPTPAVPTTATPPQAAAARVSDRRPS